MTEDNEINNDTHGTHRTEEEVDHALKELVDGPRDGDPHDMAAPPSTGQRVQMQPVRPSKRPGYFGIATPEAVAAEAEAEAVAVERLNEIVEAHATLRQEREAAEADYRRAVAHADTNGLPAPKPPKARDWEAERIALEARGSARAAVYDQARRALRDAIREALPRWSERIVDMINPAREALAAAIAPDTTATLPEVVAAEEHLRQVLAAAALALYESGHRPVPSLRPRPGSPNLGQFVHAWQALRDVCASDDPTLTGEHMTTRQQLPVASKWEREEWLRSGGGAYMDLVALEKSENYRHTSYTRDHALALGGEVVQHTRVPGRSGISTGVILAR